MKNLWWGYIHTSGSVQVKRYFDQRDIDDANESTFVDRVFGPWPCDSREEAIKKITGTLTPPQASGDRRGGK